jgi:tRNA 2-thiouridine synthesizing protein A
LALAIMRSISIAPSIGQGSRSVKPPSLADRHSGKGAAMTATTLDATGLKCPIPVLRARKRLKEVEPGGILTVLATDPAAVKDFTSFCEAAGHELVGWSKAGDVLTIEIRKSE